MIRAAPCRFHDIELGHGMNYSVKEPDWKSLEDMPETRGLLESFRAVRARSLSIASPLSDEDMQSQSMEDASPVKWHLAHSSWFFETFVRKIRRQPPF
jgi:hypothetical protein